MKLIILAAAGLMAVTATSAVAQYNTKPPAPYNKPVDRKPVYIPPPPPPPAYTQGTHRYQHRHHVSCHEKAHRLHHYERHAAADGYISPREHDIIRALKRDLRRTCFDHRYRG